MEELTKLIQKADRVYEDAHYLFFERKSYDSAVSRAYYALFYYGEAILLTKGILTNSHQGVSVLFSKHFVKENLIEADYGRIISNVFKKRQLSDYEVSVEVTEAEASDVLRDVASFMDRIRTYLHQNGYLPA